MIAEVPVSTLDPCPLALLCECCIIIFYIVDFTGLTTTLLQFQALDTWSYILITHGLLQSAQRSIIFKSHN